MSRRRLVARLAWYLRRASVMSPAEIPHRVAERVRVRALERRGPDEALRIPVEEVAFLGAAAPVLALPWEPAATGPVDELLDGRWPALAWPWCFTGEDDDWRRAPDTGRLWPSAPASRVPYRAGNPVGDARVVWEPARLQQLVALAALAVRSGDAARSARAVALVEAQLLSFWRLNPPYTGVHYVSAMECALRLIAVAHSYDMLRGRFGRGRLVQEAVLGIVTSHAELIERKLSLHSSAGNHTIAECVGLVYAGALFSELGAADHWHRVGAALLASEAERQVLVDGGGVEQATWYLQFVADLLELVAPLLGPKDPPAARVAASAARRANRFLEALSDGAAPFPRIGDSDDGFALVPHGRAPSEEHEPVAALDDSGYTVVRRGPTFLVFDHGPLGLPPSFGHGHADALSVLIRWNGHDILSDAGTLTYTGDPAWRRFFRSTAAHNTVLVDERDQAVPETAFMWSRPFRCRLLHREITAAGRVRLLASHDGYRRRGVLHVRAVGIRPDGGVVVVDQLQGHARNAQLRWHTPHEIERTAGGRLHCRVGEAGFSITLSGGEPRLLRAAADAGGWIAPRYGERRPATTIVLEAAGQDVEFVSAFAANGVGAELDEVETLRQLCRRAFTA